MLYKTKNELLDLNKSEINADYESKKLINRSNLRAFSPSNSYLRNDTLKKTCYTNSLNLFKSENCNCNSNYTNNVIRSKSPLNTSNKISFSNNSNYDKDLFSSKKSLYLFNNNYKQNSRISSNYSKLDLKSVRDDIIYNNKRHEFTEKKAEIVNLLKSRAISPYNSSFHQNSMFSSTFRNLNNNHKNVSPKTSNYLTEKKNDSYLDNKPNMSLKQLDNNLKYSKIDFCTYYSSQPKICLNSKLNDSKFNNSQNKIFKLLGKLD